MSFAASAFPSSMHARREMLSRDAGAVSISPTALFILTKRETVPTRTPCLHSSPSAGARSAAVRTTHSSLPARCVYSPRQHPEQPFLIVHALPYYDGTSDEIRHDCNYADLAFSAPSSHVCCRPDYAPSPASVHRHGGVVGRGKVCEGVWHWSEQDRDDQPCRSPH